MAKYKKNNAPSMKYLQNLWREAVKAVHGSGCALHYLGGCLGEIECHHIVKRGHGVLTNDWHNGLPLCQNHHNAARQITARREIERHVDMVYLESMDGWLLKDYLQKRGISRAEYLREELEELKAVIQNPAPYREWLE